LAAFAFAAGAPVAAQSAAHTHMGHVADGFANTPEGQGLLPTAIAEAGVADQHAQLALRDLSDLDAIKRHTGHVLHAIDPNEMASGPGAGYGLKRAAEGVVRHIEMAGADESASENVATHSTHVATAAANTVERSDEIISLGHQIMAAETAQAAAPLLEQLASITAQLLPGVDANGDGRTGWQEGEGGLQQAEQHMGLMKRGEGMGGR
jgi:hypothetical protein